MKTKFWSSILVCFLLMQPVFSLAQTNQPTNDTDICAAPGETMLLYQRFQQDMASVLLGGILGEQMFDAQFSVMGLFTSKILHLPTTNNSALDTIRQTIYNNSRRLGTATTTTAVLLALAGVSVGASNIEGFAILFQNRAIVRDYKSLLQIETKLNQIAYFLGTRTNLVAKLDNTGNGGALQTIVEKYVEEGLFTGSVRNDQTTYVGILTSLMRMNAGMKQFLSFRSTLLLNNIGKFYGTTFSEKALSNLKSEYSGARFIDSCNTMGKKAFARIGDTGNAVGSSFKQATHTIRTALKKLGERMRNVLPESLGVAEKYFDASELQHLRTVYGINTSKMTESEAKSRLKIIGDIARALSKKKAANDANKKTDSLTEQATKANPDDNPQTKEDAIKSARARALEAIYYQLGGRETTFTGGTREERVRELFSSKYKKTYGAAADTNKKEDIARLKAEIQKILEKENLIAEYRKRYNQDIPTKKQNDVKRIKKEIRKAEQIAEKEKKKVAREERKTALKEAKFSNLFTTNTDKRDMAYTIGVPYNTNFEDTLHNAFSESTRNTQEFFLRIQDNFVIVDNSSQTTQFNTIVHQIHTLEEIMKNGETNGKQKTEALFKIIEDICEYQCSNKGNKGCKI